MGISIQANHFIKEQFLFEDVFCAKSLQSCPTLCDPMDCSQPPLSMGFSRQEYQSGLPFHSPGHFSGPGIKFESLEPPYLKMLQ